MTSTDKWNGEYAWEYLANPFLSFRPKAQLCLNQSQFPFPKSLDFFFPAATNYPDSFFLAATIYLVQTIPCSNHTHSPNHDLSKQSHYLAKENPWNQSRSVIFSPNHKLSLHNLSCPHRSGFCAIMSLSLQQLAVITSKLLKKASFSWF